MNIKNLSSIKNFSLEYYDLLKKDKKNSFKKISSKKFLYLKSILQSNINKKISHKKIIILSSNNLELILLTSALIYECKDIIIINANESKINILKNIKSIKNPFIIYDKKINYNEIIKFKNSLPINFFFKKRTNNFLKKNSETINFSLTYFSSGTTGKPKIIKINYKAIKTQINQINERLKISNMKHKLITAMPCTHIGGFFFIFLNGLFFDKKIILINSFDPMKFEKILSKNKLSLIYVNPTMVELLNLFNKKKMNLKNSTFICGSAPLNKFALKKFLSNYKCKFIHLYGLTETTNTSCTMPINLSKKEYSKMYFNFSAPSIGTPLKGVKIKILKKNKEIYSEKKTGELVISGPNIIDKKNSPNSNYFLRKYLKSGDLGYFVKHNRKKYYYISGRKKEMIIKNGINIYLNEIDSFFKRKNLNYIFAINKHSQISGEDYFLVTSKLTAYNKNLKKEINLLPEYMKPKEMVLVKKIPYTLSGKLKRFEIIKKIKNEKGYELKRKFIF